MSEKAKSVLFTVVCIFLIAVVILGIAALAIVIHIVLLKDKGNCTLVNIKCIYEIN